MKHDSTDIATPPHLMRIAVISVHGCPCIQPGGVDAGGMNVYVHQTATRLALAGHEITVFSRCHQCNCTPVSILGPGAELRHVKAGDIALQKNELHSILDEFIETVDTETQSEKTKYDLIASHYWLSGIVANELAERWNIPHIASFHTLARMKMKALLGSSEPEKRIESEPVIAQKADRIVVWTDAEANFINAEFGANLEKIEVIPPGIDTDLFHPSANQNGHPVKNPKPSDTVLYVGRLDPLKGLDLLIEMQSLVCSQRPGTLLQIVGGGSEEQFKRVRELTKLHGIENDVEIFGVEPHKALPALYANADIIVAPSSHETFGFAVLEAAACGTPAVAADVDGLRSIVSDDVTGYLIQNRNAQSYADKVLHILENRKLRSTMSKAARDRAMQMPWDLSIHSLEKLYTNVAQQIPEYSQLR